MGVVAVEVGVPVLLGATVAVGVIDCDFTTRSNGLAVEVAVGPVDTAADVCRAPV